MIPEFGHVRGLIQFNQLHKYTVDEHILRCIGNAERLAYQNSILGQAYQEIRDKKLLHIALLIHDVGKGHERDHCELGVEIATRTAQRFGLDTHQRETLEFLVREHLIMSDLAFRRDTSDEQIISKFLRTVGTPEVLKMLFVLTACDITSVGPDTWTSWKEQVLTDIYVRCMGQLGGDLSSSQTEHLTRMVHDKVRNELSDLPADWLEKQLSSLTGPYVMTYSEEQIALHLRAIHQLQSHDVICEAQYHQNTKVCEYTVYTREDIGPGIFSKIAGALSAKGVQILAAQISTDYDGVVVDRFEVYDFDFEGEPPAARFAEIQQAIRNVLLRKAKVRDLFQSTRLADPRYDPLPDSLREPTDVRIDTDSSDRYTILDVFAADRQGLLYVITRTMYQLGLSVGVAKIGTTVDQAVDVFYVTDQSGKKIVSRSKLAMIKERLIEAIDDFEQGESTLLTVQSEAT